MVDSGDKELGLSGAGGDGRPRAGEVMDRELAGAQRATLDLLLLGKSIAETARSAGVSRMTIHRWLKNDPVFRAAYNEWQEQSQESCRSRLQALTDKATDALEKALEAGDARSAVQLLKGMGMIKERKPGATEQEDVKREIEGYRRKKSSKAMVDEMGWDLD